MLAIISVLGCSVYEREDVTLFNFSFTLNYKHSESANNQKSAI